MSAFFWSQKWPFNNNNKIFDPQIEQRELQAEAERLEREMELERAREAERQKKLDEAAAKQRAREKEIEEREVSRISLCYTSLGQYNILSVPVH